MLGFKDTLDCVIWFRIGVVMDKIKHPIIGTVFLPSIILAIYLLYQSKLL